MIKIKIKDKDMKYGICLKTFIPVRIAESHKSEMVSQLLFGESYTVLEDKNGWIRICCSMDNYTGWIDQNDATGISEHAFRNLNQPPVFVLNTKIIGVVLEDGTEMKVLPGSTLPFFDPFKRELNIEKRSMIINEKPETGVENASVESVIKTALGFINAPYLWGGRSLFGIDCSGFTQVVFKINNIFLPRDASQQVLSGKPIADINEALPGDLAFFINNDDKISHVGILLENGKIIHASGSVRIDYFDKSGIQNAENKTCTHQFKTIRRYLNHL